MNERALSNAALAIQDPTERSAYLDRECAGQAELRARVERLLQAHESAGSFLNVPVIDPLSSAAGQSPDRTTDFPFQPTAMDGEDDDKIPLDFLQPSIKPGSLGSLGHYEILQVLGCGGFGIVFRAFDEKLHRQVAVKAMNPQLASTSPPRKRFLREARSVAAIKHENIVQIYSVEEQPLPYLVMEFVQGQTLQQKLDGAGPLDTAEVLHLGRQMANGLAAAHTLGLIHRDIKPGNILLEQGAEQKVKITDFGLARAADDASMTQTGIISGTPMYMAPEQAMGQPLDARSDLFSLGSVLYQMCCGRPPFRGPNAIAVLRRVVEENPRALREVLPEIPTWLATIVGRLHAKNPDERYQTAAELAELLGKCQTELQARGKVTCVAPENRANERLDVAARRPMGSQRGAVALVGVTLALLAAFAVAEVSGVAKFTGPANDAKVAVRPPELPANDQGGTSAAPPSVIASSDADQAKQQQGGREPPTDHDNTRRTQLTPDEIPKLHSLEGHTNGITSVCVNHDGTLIASSSYDDSARVWDPSTGYLKAVFTDHDHDVWRLSFSPSSNRIASPSHDGTVKVWDADTKQVDCTFAKHGTSVVCAAFSSDGKWVASGGDDQMVRVWDATTAKEEFILKGHSRQLIHLAFSPVGTRLASADWDGTVIVWNAKTKKLERKLAAHAGGVFGVCFSADGRRLATCGRDATVKIWNLEAEVPQSSEPLLVFKNHAATVTAIAYSPNGHWIASGGDDKTLRIWHANSGREVVVLNQGFGSQGLCFSPDGKKLIAPVETVVNIWDVSALSTVSVDVPPATGWPADAPPPAIAPFDAAQAPDERKPLGFQFPGFAQWMKDVVNLPADEQVAAVSKKFIELNPGFDGKLEPVIRGGAVVKLMLRSNALTDLSPVRAFPKLSHLEFANSKHVADLSPLAGLRLEQLHCGGTAVTDLSPLSESPLTNICCDYTPVSDLSPLNRLKLTVLGCTGTQVSDLSPLSGMPLTKLFCGGSKVKDLTPLKGVPLEVLFCDSTHTADLSPLKGAPLKELYYTNFDPEFDSEILRSFSALRTMNGKSIETFWNEVEARKKDATSK